MFIFLTVHSSNLCFSCKLNNTCLSFSVNNTCVTADELKAFADFVISSYESGVKASNTLDNNRWNYGSAIFYAITVITTIGMSCGGGYC